MKSILYRFLAIAGLRNQRRVADHANTVRRSYLPIDALDLIWNAIGSQKILYLDVGARRGVSTKHWEFRKYFDFVLFEPDPKECAYLADYYSDVRNEALGDRKGTVELHLTQDPGGSYTSSNDQAAAYYSDDMLKRAGVVGNKTNVARSVSVPMRRLDDSGLDGLLGFLKIDVQGEELSVLRGLGELRPACIKVEISSKTVSENASQLEQFLQWAREKKYILVGAGFSERESFLVEPEFNLAFQGDFYLVDSAASSDEQTGLLAAFMMIAFGSYDFALSLLNEGELRNKIEHTLRTRSKFSLDLALNPYNNAHDARKFER